MGGAQKRQNDYVTVVREVTDMLVQSWPRGRLLKGVVWATLLWTYVMVISRLGNTPDGR